MTRALRALAVALGGLLLLGAGVVGWIVWGSLPEHDGAVAVPGLERRATIFRDAHGVPTIEAPTEAAALFALGYAHAQDRLWQMEFNRRLAQGRLAEILGPAAVSTDKVIRTLGLYRHAQATVAAMDAPERALAEAYAAGVNAYLQTRRGPLPPEFWLTRTPAPAPWTPVDSAAWTGVMAWDLSSASTRFELNRLRLAAHFTREEIDEFRPPSPNVPLAAVADFVQMYRTMGLIGAAAGARGADARPTELTSRNAEPSEVCRSRESGNPEAATTWLPAFAGMTTCPDSLVTGFGAGEGLGSNNWVVAGSRSASGAPLLANDPHLGMTTPSVWYFARLQAPGLDVFGATMPGVPYVILGRNRNVAWGFTNTHSDVQDVFIERLNPADPAEYLTPTGPARFDEREEVIAVRGAEPVRLTVRSTRHGPVLSGVLGAADKALAPDRGYVLALQWAWLAAPDRSWRAIRGFNLAADAAGFVAATRDWELAQQNIVYADRAGRIGLIAPGRIPQRRADNDLFGLAPAPGWDARYDWAGWLPHESMPQAADPPAGFIATANNDITPPGYPHFLTGDWPEPDRADRIAQLLAARSQHDAASFARIQADVTSLAARQMLDALRGLQPALAPESAAARTVWERLSVWDGSLRADAPEPLLYHTWLRKLHAAVFDDDLGDLAADFPAAQATLLAALRGQTRARDWCDNRKSARRESCATLAAETLEDTVTELGAGGRDLLSLRWGEAHPIRLEHRPLSNVPLLGHGFGRSAPMPGDGDTINVGALRLRGAQPFDTSHAASFRAIYDLAADGVEARWIGVPGQSGHPAARQYDDLLDRWLRVELLAGGGNTRPAATLTLEPR
ncbi:MAG: penicillin acylase family protein [Betaproteobacteria bacterium]